MMHTHLERPQDALYCPICINNNTEYVHRKASVNRRLDSETRQRYQQSIRRARAEIKENVMTETIAEPVGNALALPGDIEAVDGRDLLDQLVQRNLSAVNDRIHSRECKKWVADERGKIRDKYRGQALEAYNKIWNTCGESSVGHNFRMLEVRGYNINQCQDCKFCGPYNKRPTSLGSESYSYRNQIEISKSMNVDMANALAEEMIKLDKEASILRMPDEDDFELSRKSKPIEAIKGRRRLFGGK